jgi:hypothetical protein
MGAEGLGEGLLRSSGEPLPGIEGLAPCESDAVFEEEGGGERLPPPPPALAVAHEVAPLLAEAIRRIADESSVSSLFD